jgi:hypothetical protein
MNAVNVATVLHRMAKFASGPGEVEEEWVKDPRFVALRSRAVQYVLDAVRAPSEADLGPWCLSIVVWAHATLKISDPVLFRAVAQLASARLSEFKPFEISNAAWAFAKAGVVHQEFFNAVATEVVQRIDELSRQCVATLCWAFGTVRMRNETLFQVLGQMMERSSYDARANEIANTVWAFSILRCGSVNLFVALAECCRGKLYSFKPMDLANLTWAYAQMQFRSSPLFTEAVEATIMHVGQNHPELEPSHLAIWAWAYARLEVRNQTLYSLLFDRLRPKLSQLTPAEQANVCWATAKAAPDRDIIKRIVSDATRRRKRERTSGFTPNQLACVVAASKAVHLESPELTAIVREELSNESDSKFDPTVYLYLMQSLTNASPGVRGGMAECLREAVTRTQHHKDEFTMPQMVNLSKALLAWHQGSGRIFEVAENLANLAAFFQKKFIPQCSTTVDVVIVTEALSPLLSYDHGITMHEDAMGKLGAIMPDSELPPELSEELRDPPPPALACLEEVLIERDDDYMLAYFSDEEEMIEFELGSPHATSAQTRVSPVHPPAPTVRPPAPAGSSPSTPVQAKAATGTRFVERSAPLFAPPPPAPTSPTTTDWTDARGPLAARLLKSMDEVERERVARPTDPPSFESERALRVGEELTAMVTEGRTQPPYIHRCELEKQTALKKPITQLAEPASYSPAPPPPKPDTVWYGEQQIFVSRHLHNAESFSHDSTVHPLGVSVIDGGLKTLLPHFKNGSVRDLMHKGSMTIADVLVLVSAVLDRLPLRSILKERGAGKSSGVDALEEVVASQFTEDICVHVLLHPSQILVDREYQPHFNVNLRHRDTSKFNMYRAPEFAQEPNASTCTEAAVVYSIGVLLYCLLLGTVPQNLDVLVPEKFGVRLDESEIGFDHRGRGRIVLELIKTIRGCMRKEVYKRVSLRHLEETLGWLTEMSRTLNCSRDFQVPSVQLAKWSEKYSKNTFLQFREAAEAREVSTRRRSASI